jgi:hypothetical protein
MPLRGATNHQDAHTTLRSQVNTSLSGSPCVPEAKSGCAVRSGGDTRTVGTRLKATWYQCLLNAKELCDDMREPPSPKVFGEGRTWVLLRIMIFRRVYGESTVMHMSRDASILRSLL